LAWPDETTFYYSLLAAWAAAAGVFFAVLLRTPAPYGRFSRPGWGRGVPNRVAWAVMESPAVVVVAFLFVVGRNKSPECVAFLALWMSHYVYRTIVYPLRMRSAGKMPSLTVLSAAAFQVVNAYLQGRGLFTILPSRGWQWLTGGRFVLGACMFVAGLAVVLHSDSVLRSLRRPGEGAYRIPHGGLFRWVSCPNYLGEMIEWAGWAVLTWSPAGLAFAVWTAANLVPRALANHRWYRRQFPDYPPRRKAVLPWIL